MYRLLFIWTCICETCLFYCWRSEFENRFTATYCVMFSCKFDSIQMSWNTQITVHANTQEENISWCIFPAVEFRECFCPAQRQLSSIWCEVCHIHTHTHTHTSTQCHSNTYSEFIGFLAAIDLWPLKLIFSLVARDCLLSVKQNNWTTIFSGTHTHTHSVRSRLMAGKGNAFRLI